MRLHTSVRSLFETQPSVARLFLEPYVDRHALALLIPILALSIPVLALAISGLNKYWRIRLEEAKLRAGQLGEGGLAEVADLRVELDQVRRELAEVHERLDFTERLLAQQPPKERLPGS